MVNHDHRCISCLMPPAYPGLDLNSEGVCNQCIGFNKKELLGEERFLELLGSKKGRDYDCLLGISGGKDSCYVAYLAAKRYNLRALAVCYDFPFLTDLARTNVQRVCDSLGLDLLVIKSKNNLEYRLLRNHLLSVGGTGTSWGQCIFCHYGIEAVLYNVAKARGIPFILGGITKYELWNPGSRTKFLFARVKELPAAEKAGFAYYQAKAYACLVEQRRQFPIPGNSVFDVYRRATLPPDSITGINVFDYVRWDQSMIENTLMKETSWEMPDKSISWRYDCVLEPFLDYTYKWEFGISTVGIYLSNLIRDGRIERVEALHILERSEDEEMLRGKLQPVFDFLKLPYRFGEVFFERARRDTTR